MGKGDRKTRRGKLWRGSYGNRRLKNTTSPSAPTAKPSAGKKATTKKKTVKKAVKKTAKK